MITVTQEISWSYGIPVIFVTGLANPHILGMTSDGKLIFIPRKTLTYYYYLHLFTPMNM
jgi:hypothetical protein